jgi:hypothetical protein
MSLAARQHVTADEYLRLEAESSVRHEYVGGSGDVVLVPCAGISIPVDEIHRGL